MSEDFVYAQIKKEFVLKSSVSSYGIIAATILFLIMNEYHGYYGLLSLIVPIVIIILNVIRLSLYYNFKSNRIELKFAITSTRAIILFNSTLWFVFSIFLMANHNFLLDYNILFLFLTLVGFSVSSISNLYWDRVLLIFCSLCYLMPIMIFSFYKAFEFHQFGWLVILLLSFVNLFYIFQTSKITLAEANARIFDAEELKKTLEKVEVANRALEIETFNKFQATRMASLVDLASGISHEINNPLTIIHLYVVRLIDGEYGELTPDQQERLLKVRTATERIDKVVNGLRNVTDSISFDDFTENNLGTIIESVLEIYLEKAKLNDVKILVDEVPNVKVLCIAPQISHILINLLDNAIEAIVKDRLGKNIYIKFLEENNVLKMRVVNDGNLIPKENVSKIFAPFFTTKEVGTGPGLGLTLANSLANGNGGTLEYEVFQNKPSFILSIKKHRG